MEGETNQPSRQNRRIIPSNPYEVEATKAIVQRHIDAGEIEQRDIDIMKSSYKMVTTASFLGSTLMGGGSYFYMKRKMPRWSLGPRMLFAGGLGMVGSFIGFTVGGVGAAMEVQNRMTDPQRKMKIMADIAMETRKAIEESRASGGMPSSFPSSSSTSQGSFDNVPSSKWDAEGDRERQQEHEREKGLQRQIGRIEGDFDNAQRSTTSTIAEDVKKEAGSAWDKIRSQRPAAVAPRPQASVDNVMGRKEDTRSKEQREFDELLERERSGVEANETWK